MLCRSGGNHGTHVAGTIAAVNNNGLGVCGIAGGDNINDIAGVRIMSCQIFEDDRQASGASAIKWSCDNGAIISQNSWGYDDIDYLPASDKAAIDYFIKYAGLDENGNQVAPMQGGIVIFAAGNENKNFSSPSSYSEVIAVTSISGGFERAYYSNFGDWTDIIAPGGDYKKGNAMQVYSTLINNQYGYMQGDRKSVV